MDFRVIINVTLARLDLGAEWIVDELEKRDVSVTLRTIRNWRNGLVYPRAETIGPLAEVLDVPAKELLASFKRETSEAK